MSSKKKATVRDLFIGAVIRIIPEDGNIDAFEDAIIVEQTLFGWRCVRPYVFVLGNGQFEVRTEIYILSENTVQKRLVEVISPNQDIGFAT
jgi:hypothetical protein